MLNRVYLIDYAGRIVDRMDYEFESDDEAVEAAHDVLAVSGRPSVEIWENARKLTAVQKLSPY
jgi:hypothetical protein